MRTDLTDITVVIDRSGSMSSIRSDAEGGINAFVESQKIEPGQAFLTLVQFDTRYEFVHKGVPISQVPPFKLLPRGSTALLDAIGRTINETGVRLAAMDQGERPGLVIFMIVTDGQENASKEFTRARIREMIEHQQNDYRWQFTFLAANQDAFAEGASLGIAQEGIADFAGKKITGAYAAAGKKTSRMRKALGDGAALDNGFTAEERDAML